MTGAKMYNIFYCNLFKISNKLLDAELNTLPRFIQEQIKEKQNKRLNPP